METLNNKLPAIWHLFSWSHNYNFPSPFSVFLDLVGYSEEEFGEPLVPGLPPSLGYLELHLLGAALSEYSEYYSLGEDYIRFLLFCESEELDWDDEANPEVAQALEDFCPWHDRTPELVAA